jgi:hypothetical protein
LSSFTPSVKSLKYIFRAVQILKTGAGSPIRLESRLANDPVTGCIVVSRCIVMNRVQKTTSSRSTGRLKIFHRQDSIKSPTPSGVALRSRIHPQFLAQFKDWPRYNHISRSQDRTSSQPDSNQPRLILLWQTFPCWPVLGSR